MFVQNKLQIKMKRILLYVTLVVFGAINLTNAQLADNSQVPNFTATDINGTSHTLYDYLDDGYTVFIDFSATWCGPCWSFHQSHALRDLYEKHGPTGLPGVLSNTTDDVMVFFVEGDASTTSADLNGTTSSSQGDWVTGTTYPILDNAALKTPYQICGYPNLFVICPNRLVKKSYCGFSSSQMTEPNLYTQAGTCPQLVTGDDASLISYTGTTATCSDVNLKVRIQNNGTNPLTACTIVTKNGANVINTYNWSGSLATYDVQEVTLGTVSIASNANLNIEITTTDGNSSNNTITQAITKALQGNDVITVSVSTDRYGSETEWTLKNSNGQTILSGGPYTDASSSGSYPQPDKVIVAPVDCYTFEITDSYGDGMCCSYGNGAFSVKDGTGLIFAEGGTFENSDKRPLEVKSVSSVQNGIDALLTKSGVYPNPAKENFSVYFNLVNNSNVSYTITNTLGQLLVDLNLGNLNKGTHAYSIATSSFTSGLYFVTLNVNNETKVFKLNIEK
jgi:hypothetical protein